MAIGAKMFQIYFYVPKSSANEVKEAMFAAGAGEIGNYSHCSWECEGIGQYKPKQGANPAIGNVGELERVTELKVEMVCAKECLKDVINAMLNSHPYEEVAYGVVEIVTLQKLP